ncbi:MAG: hypothetical protein HC848_04705 [Limnobacter sp.]|nr:hypothetical protein [Limnobacter sp.]
MWSNRFNVMLVTYAPAALVALALLGLCHVTVNGDYNRHLESERSEVLQKAALIRAGLEGVIQSNANLVRGLKASIATEPKITQTRFAALASELFEGDSVLRNIVLRLIW